MTEKNKINSKLTLSEIILIAILSILFLLVPLVVFFKNVDLDYIEKPVNIGNNLGGLLAPFLSLAGSILVYIAFKAQIQANKEIQNQFTKQNNDQHFYRLIDSLDKRITQYSFTENKEQYSGYNILTLFLKKIRINLENKMPANGQNLFIKHPELIPDSDYQRIYPHFNNDVYINPKKVKEALLNSQPKDREEVFSNGLLEFQMHSGESFESGMRAIAISNFYKVPVNAHLRYYHSGIRELISSNASFFDGYFKTLELILNHIHQNNDDSFYVNYLKGNLTTIEKSVIFLYLGCFKNKPQMNNLILKYGILEDLSSVSVRGIKIGNPSITEYLEHIKSFLKT